jgi:hypothetical protein
MAAGRVDTLVILGGNPVFTAPADFHFTEHLPKVSLRIHRLDIPPPMPKR